MKGINDGDPAYPCQELDAAGNPREAMRPGVSLRAHFAGQALAGWAAGRNSGDTFVSSNLREAVAEACVKYADALIAELEKGQI